MLWNVRMTLIGKVRADLPLCPYTCLRSRTMEGVTVLRNEMSRMRYVRTDMDWIERGREGLEDLLDGLLSESRKNELIISLSDPERRLRKSITKFATALRLSAARTGSLRRSPDHSIHEYSV